VPRSIISFSFKDFEEEATFRGLSDITSHIEDFFLKAGAGAGMRIVTVIIVFGVVGIIGILKLIGTIIGAVKIGAASDVGSSCARHSKTVS
jgi:hypothetical protein